MQIDYKIKDLKLNTNGISATVVIYGGDVTTEAEYNADTFQDENITRYRRTQVLKTMSVNLTPDKVIRLFEKWVNKQILQEAADRGVTVISEQQSTSV